MIKICNGCEQEFETLYSNKNYCTVRCRNREKNKRASTRDKVTLVTRQSDGQLRLPFPTKEQIATAIRSVHSGGKPVVCLGAMPEFDLEFDDVEVVKQQTEIPEWLIIKKEVDIMAAFMLK